MNKIRFLYLFLLFFLIFLSLNVYSADKGELWNEIIVKYKAHKVLNLYLSFEQKFVQDFSLFGTHNYGFGAVVKPLSFLDIEMTYLFEQEKENNVWENEHRLGLVPKLKWKLITLDFSLRNRLEYRIFETKNEWRLREQIKIKRTFDLIVIELTPFLAEEMFISFKEGEYNQNRLSIGLTLGFNKHFEMSLYYMLNSRKEQGIWEQFHILGTEFEISF